MMISSNTQLGLRFKDHVLKRDFLQLRLDDIHKSLDESKERLSEIEKEHVGILIKMGKDQHEAQAEVQSFRMRPNAEFVVAGLDEKLTDKEMAEELSDMMLDNGEKTFLITAGVEAPSKRIKVGENFSGTAFASMKPGKYTYLLGRNEMCRFVVKGNFLRGFYFDDVKRIAFEFFYCTSDGTYHVTGDRNDIFTRITQLILFIHLGDIEVIMIEAGRNNGKGKKDGKVTNNSNNTVYVVDSSWNQLIIRTEGFAVMGHFRLQPCGVAMRERKLIWIDAFEKHGYKRRPRAQIID